MSYYKHTDKKSGDGLALTDWNNLSNAVAGHQGLTLAINTSDKIGIGSTPSTEKLEVNGNAIIGGPDADVALKIGDIGFGSSWAGIANGKSANSKDYALVQNKDGKTALNSASNQLINFNQGDDPKMTINNGNVGIGTISPNHKLDVDGNINATGFIGDGSQINNIDASKITSGTINVAQLPAGLAIANGGSTNFTGNVGIGITSPNENLEVVGNAIIGAPGVDLALKIGDVGFGGTWAGIANAKSANKKDYALVQNSDGRTILNSSESETINFSQGDYAKMTIKNGNVGIGTESPSATLDVERGTGNDGTAVFRGTDPNRNSNFNYSTSQDTYIRGGKKNSNVFINDNGGNVGIGTSTPMYTLHVGGHMLADDYHTPSDRRLKTNIDKEKNILHRLLQLEVKTFNWKSEANKSKQKTLGFIAQDVQLLFPSLVSESHNKEIKENRLALTYPSFGVLAVGAIQELKEQTDEVIASLKEEINTLKEEINTLKEELKSILVKN